jgi:hypothetical protein
VEISGGSVITCSGVYKRSINLICNPYPASSHTPKTRDNIFHILSCRKLYCRIHKNPSLNPVVFRLNPVPSFMFPYFRNDIFHLDFKVTFFSRFSSLSLFLSFSLSLSPVYYISRPCHSNIGLYNIIKNPLRPVVC